MLAGAALYTVYIYVCSPSLLLKSPFEWEYHGFVIYCVPVPVLLQQQENRGQVKALLFLTCLQSSSSSRGKSELDSLMRGKEWGWTLEGTGYEYIISIKKRGNTDVTKLLLQIPCLRFQFTQMLFEEIFFFKNILRCLVIKPE